MKRIISFLLIAALVLSFVPFSAFAAEIDSISYTPADENSYTFCEGENAELRHDETTDTDYYSYAINFNEGDTLTAYYNDGSHKDFVAEFIDGEIYFVNGNDRIKQWDDITREEDQQENHWGIGEHKFYVVYSGHKAEVIAKIIKNPVDSISYQPVNGVVTRYFETGGQIDTDNEGHDYYRYNPIERSTGDVLTVHYNDGRGDVRYVLTFDPEARFVSESDPGDVIDERDVRMDERQREHPFTLGDENYYYVSYRGKETTVRVNIVNNPIASIVYEPASSYEIYEHADGEWRDRDGQQYFDYNMPGFRENDKLTITFNDERGTVVYTYSTDEGGFYDNANNPLPDSDKLYRGREGDWELGNDNYMFVEYMDNRSNQVRISIVENPVKGIRFEREFSVQFVEGSNMYHDSWDNADYYSIPWHREGDKLIVIDKENSETTYEYQWDGDVFVAEGKDDIPADQVRFNSNQRENPWVIGNNTYTVEYLGYTYDLTATITANPIDSIEYIPLRPTKYFVGTNMYHDDWDDCDYYERPRISIGDTLIVNYSDERGRVEYTAIRDDERNEIVFKSAQGDVIVDDGSFEFYDDQRENPWGVGINYSYIKYSGRVAQIPVTIVENNMKSISYKPAEMPRVWVGDYNIPEPQEGDILTITYNDDTTKDFELIFDEADGESYFVNGDDAFHKFAVSIPENQDTSNWTVGTDNFYTIDFYGLTTEVQIEVQDTDVESISYTPVDEIVIRENNGGHFVYDNEKFYEYEVRDLIKPGDKLTVNYKDGRVVEYVLDIDPNTGAGHLVAESGEELNVAEIDIDHNQWGTHWKPGENSFDIKYHGARDTVKFIIKPAGDINGDNSVDNKDVTSLFKYLTDWDVEVEEDALDVNGDGVVNNKDLTRLFQYLSGWGVEVH